jgi:GTP-binding protein
MLDGRLPNAGKSTLLRAISAARPSSRLPIHNAEAVLGVVELELGDVCCRGRAGLIEGHMKAQVWDLSFCGTSSGLSAAVSLDSGSADPVADFRVVENEVAAYGKGVAGQPRLVALEQDRQAGGARTHVRTTTAVQQAGIEVVFVSAARREGLDDLVGRLAELLRAESEAVQQNCRCRASR